MKKLLYRLGLIKGNIKYLTITWHSTDRAIIDQEINKYLKEKESQHYILEVISIQFKVIDTSTQHKYWLSLTIKTTDIV